MKLTKLFGTLLIVIAFAGNVMGQKSCTIKDVQTGLSYVIIDTNKDWPIDDITNDGDVCIVSGGQNHSIAIRKNEDNQKLELSQEGEILSYESWGDSNKGAYAIKASDDIYIKIENGKIIAQDSPFSSIPVLPKIKGTWNEPYPDIELVKDCGEGNGVYKIKKNNSNSAITISGYNNITPQGSAIVCNNNNIYQITTDNEFYLKIKNKNGVKELISSAGEMTCNSDKIVPFISGDWNSPYPTITYIGTCGENAWIYSIQKDPNNTNSAIKIDGFNGIKPNNNIYLADNLKLLTNDKFYIKIINDGGNKQLITQSTPFVCGIEVPDIYDKSSICLSNINDLYTPTGLGKSSGWSINGSHVDDLSNVKVDDVISYWVIADNGAETTSNEVKIIDKPYIDPMSQISFCSGSSINLPTIKTNGSELTQIKWYTYNSSNVQSSYTEGSPVSSDVTKFSYDVKNACGSIQDEASVVVSDKPIINSMTIDAICEGGSFDLQANVSENNSTTTLTWERATSSSGTYSTFTNSNIPNSYNSNYIRLTAENDCGSVTSTKKVTVNPKPIVSIKKNPAAVCPGVAFDFSGVVETTDANTGKWVYKNNGADFSNIGLPYSANGTQLQYSATNSCGTTMSDPVTLTVNSDAPGFTYTKSPNQTTLTQSLGGTPASVTYTLKKDNKCNNDPISISIDNSSDFEISGNTVKLKSGKGVGPYTTTVTFTQAGETKTEDITVSVVKWPACFPIKKIENGVESIIYIETDESGKIELNVRDIMKPNEDASIQYINEGVINCIDFTIHNGNEYNGKDFQFINKGTIKAENDVNIGTSSYNLCYGSSSSPYFSNDCKAKIYAGNNINVNYRYDVQPFNGVWESSNAIKILNGQGQDIDFPLCSYVNTKEIEIDANVSNGIIIKGHVISEKISSTKDIYLKYNGTIEEDAILTVGELEGKYNSLKIIAEQYTIVNLCSNPTIGDGVTIENKGEWNEHPKGADNLGYYNGLIIYNYGEDGWPNGKNPEEEWDINYPTTDGRYSSYKAKDVVRGYATYQDCIDEKNMPELLGIDDDPFLPKDKEIRSLYNCNPCSKDFEDTKIELREIHGRTFRLINGELIYCENDN